MNACALQKLLRLCPFSVVQLLQDYPIEQCQMVGEQTKCQPNTNGDGITESSLIV